MGPRDRMLEDFTSEQARSTGFMGRTSEVAWLQEVLLEDKMRRIQTDAQGNKRQRRVGLPWLLR
jgi:hypothetical protein